MPHTQAKWVLLCLGAALVFGLVPSLARFAYADGASVLLVLLGRSIVGFLVLLAFPGLNGVRPDLSVPSIKRATTAGWAHAVAAFGILGSIAYIDVALAMIIFFLHPFPIAVVAHLKGQTPLTPAILGLMVVAIIGLAFVLGPDFNHTNPIGIIIAIVGAIAATVMIISMADVTKSVGPVNANLLLALWAAFIYAVIAIIGPLLGIMDPLSLPHTAFGWFMIVSVGISFSLGFLMFFAAANKIGTARASLLSVAEPVMMILIAIALLGERVSGLETLGIAMVIASLALSELLRAKEPDLRKTK